MKALTIWQPWASLIALGAKTIETRSWSTTYRGPLAIHAAKQWTAEQQWIRDKFSDFLPDHILLGCIIATAYLTDVMPADTPYTLRLAQFELEFGDYSPGRFAWRLENIVPLLTPIPARGQQGLWLWDWNEVTP